MTMPAARSLRDVRMADAAEVGGKAASLGELMATAVRVPEGVVLTVEGVELPPDERNRQIASAVESLGDGPFAVRSSGVAEDGGERSYAGMFETVLGVRTEDVVAATERVLASGHSARVAGYQAASDGRMAVVIQRMIEPATAGVALTADPISGDRRTCVVTAVRGTGDRLVSGESIGDEWAIRDGAATMRRNAESRDRSPTGAPGGERGDTHRDRQGRPAGCRVGDRRGRSRLDPPGEADDGAAAGCVLGVASTRRLHPDAPPGGVDRRAGYPALRILAADGDGRAHACLVPGADRPDRAQALPRRRQRLVLLLGQLHLRPRHASEPAGNARASRAHPSTPRGCDSADRSVQLPGHGAHVARGHAAALSGRGLGCRRSRGARSRSASSQS